MICTQQTLPEACPAPADSYPQTNMDRSSAEALHPAPSPETDVIIRQIRAGVCEGLFHWAYRELYPAVRQRLMKKGLSKSAARELFTDAVLDLIAGIQKNAALNDQNLAGYLWRICRNKHADLHRAKKRDGKAEAYQHWVSPVADPDAPLMAETLRRQVQRLSPGFRQIVTLYYFQGYSCGEIAEQLHSTADSVKERKCRAMKQLRAYFL